jgi:hypothetical protein
VVLKAGRCRAPIPSLRLWVFGTLGNRRFETAKNGRPLVAASKRPPFLLRTRKLFYCARAKFFVAQARVDLAGALLCFAQIKKILADRRALGRSGGWRAREAAASGERTLKWHRWQTAAKMPGCQPTLRQLAKSLPAAAAFSTALV